MMRILSLLFCCLAITTAFPHFARAETNAPAAAPDDSAAPQNTNSPVDPSAGPAPSSLPAPPFEPPRYGDRGTSEISVGLGYGSTTGFVGAAGFRYFVVDAVAPGLEATYASGAAGYSALGLLLASLRVVPLRTQTVSLVMTGRAGRVLIGDHADGWGVGGAIGFLYMLQPGAGIELGYQYLKLVPASFCRDLDSCAIQGPVIGLRLVF